MPQKYQRVVLPQHGPTATKEQRAKREKSRESSLIVDSWFWEIFAVAFSVICAVAILVLLLVYDGKASPSLPHELTLNTIVSILATASKSSLIFLISASISQLKWIWFQKEKKPIYHLQSIDDASRGPLGALKIIFQHRGYSWICLGALVTVLALAFDPFIQQIISYPVRQVPSPTDIASTKQAIFPFTLETRDAMYEPSGASDTGFNNAINTGIWSEDFNINPTCASGNCTFDPFQSTGWCSQCEDMTSQARLVGCYDIRLDNTSTVSSYTWCNVTLPQGYPSGSKINILPQRTKGQYLMELPTEIVWTVSDPNDIGYTWNKTYSGIAGPLMVLAHASFNFTYDKFDVPASHPENGIRIGKVTQCALSMCSRTYNVAVQNGIPSINMSEPDYGKYFPHEVMKLGNRSVNLSCWKPGHGPPVNVTQVGEAIGSWGVFKNASEFAICPLDGPPAKIRQVFASTSFVTHSYGYSTGWGGYVPPTYSDNLRRIVDSGLETVVTNVAASLTKHALDSSNSTIHGIVNVAQVYVHVKWAFLALPAAVLILGILFLVITILINRGQKLGLWKSSILPALYHGLDDSYLQDEHAYMSMGSMEKSAQSAKARLEFSEEKKRLVLKQ
ncbi:hypothetical protein ASPWEDRAFT_41044 [Aspergillus wentii DTO 134E9]|uniref:DUF3176 domain containing protein n=1 Tax=Aspergillus wentii DTO 134E9 TaxID=1073089 RepID=A0A1L9RLK6_ASPWE|nr:uncharacterized protein ASPWEDRAFT_41044 [Aspergillus wentii DTO 134E9]OJJ35802.1 hypothetical protein ASPWEDRAFT_41044 [Aspergillus wentii DTO 134E9]